MSLFFEPMAATEDITNDGPQVARSLATDPADPLEGASNIDSPSSGLSAPPALQADCLFLNKLPAEMRNEIYELAFTSDEHEVEINLSDFDPPRSPLLSTKVEVELSKANPPNNALLFTCRQIRSEATQLYKKVSHRHWTESHFVITDLKPNGRFESPEIQSLKRDLWSGQNPRLKPEDVNRIRHIRIFRQCALCPEVMFISTYLSESGIWRWESYCGAQVSLLKSGYLVLRASARRMFPLAHEWGVEHHKSDAETAVQQWNHKKPFHVELGSKAYPGQG